MSHACEEWKVARGFSGWDDYERTKQWVEGEADAGRAERVPVAHPYSGSTLWEERWYRCPGCAETWRLVEPDPPFKGVFGPIDPESPERMLYER